MGNVAVALKKKAGPSPFGKSIVVDLTMSSSYATGGDTLLRSDLKALGFGNRVSAVILSGNNGGRVFSVNHGANEYTDPKILSHEDGATVSGTLDETPNATNLSTHTIRAIIYASPYR